MLIFELFPAFSHSEPRIRGSGGLNSFPSLNPTAALRGSERWNVISREWALRERNMLVFPPRSALAPPGSLQDHPTFLHSLTLIHTTPPKE